MEKNESKYHVKLYFKSNGDIQNLQKNPSVELISSSRRTIDANNIIIDAFIPAFLLDEIKEKYCFRIIGSVDKMIAEACTHVSKTNRFKNH
jgi:hypothetical protein